MRKGAHLRHESGCRESAHGDALCTPRRRPPPGCRFNPGPLHAVKASVRTICCPMASFDIGLWKTSFVVCVAVWRARKALSDCEAKADEAASCSEDTKAAPYILEEKLSSAS